MEKAPELLETPAWAQRGLRGEFGAWQLTGSDGRSCFVKEAVRGGGTKGGNQMERMLLSWKGRGCEVGMLF